MVKAYRAESYSINSFCKMVEQAYSTICDRTSLSAFFQSFVTFLLNSTLVLIGLYGYHLAQTGAIPWGDLVAFGLYGATVALSAAFVASGFSDLLQSLGAVDRVLEFTSDDDSEYKEGKKISDAYPLTLSFQDVSFYYPQRPKNQVLEGITFDVNPGKFVALVGPSGAGKSTITQLALGFYPPTNGQIRLGNELIQEISLDSIREKIAVVPQDPILFSGSIEENLRVGDPDASETDLLNICEAVNMHEFITTLPEGLSTKVGERGLQLSGGQRQRLAIARALLASPDLLILDEATSSLDSQNEALLQQTLSQLTGKCSLLVIAHRLATIQRADEILVIDKGGIRERGRHEDLIEEGGLYAELVREQSLGDQK
jgi:ABC-type multidrug transport system fused ATPase/permease subunit